MSIIDTKEVKLLPVTDDICRFQDPGVWIESINFRADSGYDMDTLYRRVMGSVNRCFKQGHGARAFIGWDISDLPTFNVNNRVMITITMLPAEDAPKPQAVKPSTAPAQPAEAATSK